MDATRTESLVSKSLAGLLAAALLIASKGEVMASEPTGSVDPKQTLTVTFGPEYFFGRQRRGNYPVPSLGPIQRTVRRAILTPELLEKSGQARTARASC